MFAWDTEYAHGSKDKIGLWKATMKPFNALLSEKQKSPE